MPPGIEISSYYAMHFSPDGKRLMLSARDMRDRWGIYSVDLASGAAELLMRQPQDLQLRSGGWGEDGSTWFYVLQYREGGVHSIYRMDPGATEGREIYSISDRGQGGKIMRPILSPQRDRLAFRVLGKQQIWVMPVEGGEARKVYESPAGGHPASIAWAPEGDALVAVVASPQSPEHQGVQRIPLNGGPAVKIELLGERMQNLSLHSDGRTVVFDDGSPEVRIWKMENYWSPDPEAGATE